MLENYDIYSESDYEESDDEENERYYLYYILLVIISFSVSPHEESAWMESKTSSIKL